MHFCQQGAARVEFTKHFKYASKIERDVSIHKLAELALLDISSNVFKTTHLGGQLLKKVESETIHERIFYAANDAIFLINHRGKTILCNPIVESILGYSCNEVIGKDLHVLMIPTRFHKAYKQGFNKLKKRVKTFLQIRF